MFQMDVEKIYFPNLPLFFFILSRRKGSTAYIKIELHFEWEGLQNDCGKQNAAKFKTFLLLILAVFQIRKNCKRQFTLLVESYRTAFRDLSSMPPSRDVNDRPSLAGGFIFLNFGK